jgi:hypothetical protein
MVPPPLGPSARRWAVAWYVVSACLDNIRAGLRARWRSNASGEITAGLATDLTRSFKGWRRRPLWVALVLTTLAVPMAATTVVFSIVDAVVLSDVPWGGGYAEVGTEWHLFASVGRHLSYGPGGRSCVHRGRGGRASIPGRKADLPDRGSDRRFRMAQ